MAKKGDAPKTHKGSMATGDSIFQIGRAHV